MSPGENGPSTPEDDDPFGYLYADGQARGAQPPSSGYGYPNSVSRSSRTRAVGERTYGGQQATAPQQQAAYGQPNAHYQAPETLPGGAPTTQQPMPGGGGGNGRGRGPNTKGLLIGAVAVVAAVVVGISVVMMNGNGDDDKKAGNEVSAAPTQSQSTKPSPSSSGSAASSADLPKSDAKALRLDGGAATASDVKGAKADGGFYVGNFNQVGASLTWNVSDIPKAGKYTLYVNYGVPGKDANATITVNGKAQDRPLNLANFAKAPEGDYEKGWTNTWGNIILNKGANTIKISCEQGNNCDVNFDQLWLKSGWRES
ncbi:CBM35 domain-containing protein [Streptomyces sp. NPDC020298]|uniref:CBM35 domain-containing protein n=1 Tax=unclassified Streptomyces TaxID=2593676 RepID=UPI0033F2314C